MLGACRRTGGAAPVDTLDVRPSCLIADDITLTLMRTSYSGIIRDSLDFSTAICDADGLTLARKPS